MSGPEIDRRCPDCGAAVRPNAAFCQQCGRPMKSSVPLSATMPALDEAAENRKRRHSDSEMNSATRPLAASSPPAATETPKTTIPPPAAPPKTAAPAIPPVSPPAPAPPMTEAVSLPAQIAREQIKAGGGAQTAEQQEDGKRWRRPGVAAAARDVVEERLAPRVEKLRQASNVVLDEAADDPNLRFILIAVLLCIVAFILILISTYLQ